MSDNDDIDLIAELLTDDPDIMLEWDPDVNRNRIDPRIPTPGWGITQRQPKQTKPLSGKHEGYAAPLEPHPRAPTKKIIQPASNMAPPPASIKTPAPAAARPTEIAPVTSHKPPLAPMSDNVTGLSEGDASIIKAIADTLDEMV